LPIRRKNIRFVSNIWQNERRQGLKPGNRYAAYGTAEAVP
jgi:hypothetical protein